jgi:hypothetical protein
MLITSLRRALTAERSARSRSVEEVFSSVPLALGVEQHQSVLIDDREAEVLRKNRTADRERIRHRHRDHRKRLVNVLVDLFLADVSCRHFIGPASEVDLRKPGRHRPHRLHRQLLGTGERQIVGRLVEGRGEVRTRRQRNDRRDARIEEPLHPLRAVRLHERERLNPRIAQRERSSALFRLSKQVLVSIRPPPRKDLSFGPRKRNVQLRADRAALLLKVLVDHLRERAELTVGDIDEPLVGQPVQQAERKNRRRENAADPEHHDVDGREPMCGANERDLQKRPAENQQKDERGNRTDERHRHRQASRAELRAPNDAAQHPRVIDVARGRIASSARTDHRNPGPQRCREELIVGVANPHLGLARGVEQIGDLHHLIVANESSLRHFAQTNDADAAAGRSGVTQ